MGANEVQIITGNENDLQRSINPFHLRWKMTPTSNRENKSTSSMHRTTTLQTVCRGTNHKPSKQTPLVSRNHQAQAKEVGN